MLQKVDKDRLVEVLQLIEKKKIKFPGATLSRELSVNKGNVSAYLKGKKPMSENFYNTFMSAYGGNSTLNSYQKIDAEAESIDLINKSLDIGNNANLNNDNYLGKMQAAFDNLSISNKLLAIAFDKQASAHEKEAEARIIQATANKILTEVNRDALNNIQNSNHAAEAQQYKLDRRLLTQTIDQMIEAGIPKRWATAEEGQEFLDSLLGAVEKKNQQASTTSQKGKMSKA